MRQETINIYKFEELSEGAKQIAIMDYRNSDDYSHIYSEAHETVKKFNKVFDTREGHDTWLECDLSDIEPDILELKGLRLRTYLINNFYSELYKPVYIQSKDDNYYSEVGQGHRMKRYNYLNSGSNKGKYYISLRSGYKVECSCPLTGVCYDMYILDHIIKMIEYKPEDRKELEAMTYEELLNDCFYSLKKSLESEIEEMHIY